jgi:hypothetical protein
MLMLSHTRRVCGGTPPRRVISMSDQEIKVQAFELTLKILQTFSGSFTVNAVDDVINDAEKVFRYIKGD